jgi:hypothetical protein
MTGINRRQLGKGLGALLGAARWAPRSVRGRCGAAGTGGAAAR